MSQISCLVFLILISASFAIRRTSLEERKLCKHERLGLAEALEATERSTDYFEKHYKKINLDGVFGYRASAGLLHSALSKININILGYSGLRLYYKILNLQKAQDDAANEALQFLKHGNQKYYNVFLPIMSHRFYYKRAPRRADLSLTYKSKVEHAFNETFSDECMSNILGTTKNGTKRAKCYLSDACMKSFGKSSAGTGYTTTHHALFFVLAMITGCKKDLVAKFGSEELVERRMDELGSNIYVQLIENSKRAQINRDLFLEQTLICNMLGIVDCMRFEWLELGISWQDKSGAIIVRNHVTHSWLKNELGDMKIDYSRKRRDTPTHRSRNLLYDVEIKGGGSSHATGLLASFSASYADWILNPPNYEALGMKSPFPATYCPFGSTHVAPHEHKYSKNLFKFFNSIF